LCPYTTLFRSRPSPGERERDEEGAGGAPGACGGGAHRRVRTAGSGGASTPPRREEEELDAELTTQEGARTARRVRAPDGPIQLGTECSPYDTHRRSHHHGGPDPRDPPAARRGHPTPTGGSRGRGRPGRRDRGRGAPPDLQHAPPAVGARRGPAAVRRRRRDHDARVGTCGAVGVAARPLPRG